MSAALSADENGQVGTERGGLSTPPLLWVQKVGLSLGQGLESQAVPSESGRRGNMQGRWVPFVCQLKGYILSSRSE